MPIAVNHEFAGEGERLKLRLRCPVLDHWLHVWDHRIFRNTRQSSVAEAHFSTHVGRPTELKQMSMSIEDNTRKKEGAVTHAPARLRSRPLDWAGLAT
jgi:hypothetical protein